MNVMLTMEDVLKIVLIPREASFAPVLMDFILLMARIVKVCVLCVYVCVYVCVCICECVLQ